MSKITSIKRLGNIAKYASVVTLLEQLDDDDVEVRVAVIEALAKLASAFPDEILLPLFARVYDEEEAPTVRATAIWALGEAGKMVDIRWLIDALYDKDWRVREQAAIALGKQGDRTPTEVLEAVLDDPSEQVCKAAVHALGKVWEHKSARLQVVSQEEGSDAEIVVGEKKDDSNKGGGTSGGATIDTRHTTQHISSGDVEFEGLDASFFANSNDIPIVAQALDNQWVPRTLLQSMLKGKITFSEAERYLEGLVRTEYIRALINGEHIIINRAFLYNNSVLFRDYLPGQASRTTFKNFLDTGIIIPFLLYEHAPDEPPVFDKNSQGFTAWQEICQEVYMKCMRFSWDDGAHQAALRRFTNRYHDFVQTIDSKELEQYAKDLGVREDEQQQFWDRLSEVHDLGTQYFREHRREKAPYITRNVLYKQFITGENPALRDYDGSKPFARQIKELLDLAYNGYLADELNGYLLTPIDSPSRHIMQEWETLMKNKESIKEGDITKLLRSNIFSLLNEGLYLKSMGSLTLQDVQKVRQTPQWSQYIQNLRALLKQPILFDQLANTVYRSYIELMKEATTLIEQRNASHGGILTAPWEPSTEVLVTVGGASLKVIWNKEGRFFHHEGDVGIGAASGTAPLAMKLTIGDRSRSRAQADLFSSIDIMQGKMADAQKQWKEIIEQFRANLLFKEYTRGPIKELATPTINEQEQS